jgi:DNA-binding PucR family transcriptional regulator
MPEMKARAIFNDVVSEVATAESKVNSNHTKGVNDLRLLKRTKKVVDREKSLKQAIPSESCRQIGGLPRGQVRHRTKNSWIATIFYAGKSQYLGSFRTENEASGYLSAVRVKLESYQHDQESQSFLDKAKAEARKTLLLSKNLDPLNLEELYQTRCAHCILCRKEDCKRCESCIRNLENMQDGNKQICLRKVRYLFSHSTFATSL